MSAAGLSMRARTHPAMRQGAIKGLSRSGFHRMAYVAWGEPNHLPPVVCVHGLTRNARDFDRLAQALAPDRYVVCPMWWGGVRAIGSRIRQAMPCRNIAPI